ncbi:MAG: GGDEF domain-containing protein [Oscillospiraceae bacterium]|nr:GGDEF domain-containing protein [Oscillospiraceae bacterium]
MINISQLSERWTQRESFSNGQVIIHDGEAPDGKMYIIETGTVCIYKNYKDVGELLITELNQGDFFGEMTLFLQKRRTATVVAKTEVTVLTIDRRHTLKFLETQPEATFSLIRALCLRLEATTESSADNSIKYEEDLTSLNEEMTALEQTANTDALTGVYNRRFFMESIPLMISSVIREGKTPFVVLFDLDHFKKVNDTYGHQAGDYVLQCFAKLINESVRTSDIFARYGGEEFIMLISCAAKEDAQGFLERIRVKINNLVINFEGTLIPITSSIGVSAAASEKKEDIDTAIAYSDRALYIAKDEGRNRVIFYY